MFVEAHLAGSLIEPITKRAVCCRGLDDTFAQGGIWGEHTVKMNQMCARRWDQRCEFADQIERRQGDGGAAVWQGFGQAVENSLPVEHADSLGCEWGPCAIAQQSLKCKPVAGLDLPAGRQVRTDASTENPAW